MKKIVIASIVSALCIGFSSLVAADTPNLATRHIQMGQQCQSCHVTQNPVEGAKVRNQQCFGCHQSYEVLAQRTAQMDPNPHFTHLGNVRCSECHSGHAQPTLMCNGCHQFDMMPK